jgi:hypothetical protein
MNDVMVLEMGFGARVDDLTGLMVVTVTVGDRCVSLKLVTAASGSRTASASSATIHRALWFVTGATAQANFSEDNPEPPQAA